ncbi:triosephosphate isomerase [Dialister histaminiformans]|uniref:Triosephosphate isomerase n=1 Tax=Allisonella histaminiformans TaxID=209880 RepID=A0A1G5V7Q4_9FIRM|nr:triose-phosphate isomerase [Allisonella histaminiformans]SDA41961.1 triosephosphate isomerase [Allisonella histaminiformans]
MRQPLIAGNWKMNLGLKEAVSLISELKKVKPNKAEMLICPPFVDLPAASEMVQGTHIQLGAQNMYPEEKGAFTGEISPAMLKELHCRYVICGHSERRHIMGESDEFIHRKVVSALAHGLTPILCTGETAEQRNEGRTEEIIREELETALFNIPSEQAETIVIAYEPIWAIGTGVAATAVDAQAVAHFIRGELTRLYGETTAEKIRILYGGSVKAANIEDFMAQKDIDGGLIGGASLKAAEFKEIYEKV